MPSACMRPVLIVNNGGFLGAMPDRWLGYPVIKFRADLTKLAHRWATSVPLRGRTKGLSEASEIGVRQLTFTTPQGWMQPNDSHIILFIFNT